RHTADPYKAVIKCKYSMSPFASKEEHGRSGPNRRSTEISKVIKEVFENLIVLEQFPKTQIDIFVDVLQADGGTRVTAITAASLALADAGIPMRELASSVAVGKAGDKIMIDLGKEEDNSGQSDMPVAISSVSKDILLLQMDGLLTKEEIEEAIDLVFETSEKLFELQKKTIKDKYLNDTQPFKM
ncbi:MAG: exosome complex exonuclease Rrp41, partial [Candidatus ainarchaeum sp.]|nr:exosome complex exonuclease Rrp41 [Candidatus ainarchaeum sp.]